MNSLLFLALSGTLLGAEPVDDLRCLPSGPDQPAASGLLATSLRDRALAALAERTQEYERLKTPDEIVAYQRRLRETMVKQLGGFPARTPLDARVVGKLDGDGYRIEKVIFASQPRHHVTANLYLPDGSGPFPGVIVSSGHSRTAKTAEYNQRFAIALARHGIAALAYDPIGQGERSQILTPEGKPQFSGTTTEHFLVGVGSILVGRNTATYRVWDAMRALDYLESRPEIDPRRLGMTGCSGGGTLTSYVMALDDRVVCAAPACYLTSFRRLLETIGPQDAEQNIFAQLQHGIDQPDYVLLRAPRPTLISATTGDFFDIQGTWDNYRQAKRIYGRLGFPERVDLVEAEGNHGVQPTNLAAIASWMQRWLVGKNDPVPLDKLATRLESELLCTEDGQVLRLADELSVFDMNEALARDLARERQPVWARMSPEQRLETVRETVGVRRRAEIPAPKRTKAGKVPRDGYHIDKLVLQTDSGVPLPALTFHPPEPQDDAYLYLHEDGKLGDSLPGGPIEKLVADGYVVVAVDLRGTGETASEKVDALLGDWSSFFRAYLVGKSIVGLQTDDTLAAAQFVAYYQTEKPRRVHLVGVGRAATVALHAAALEPDLFASVTLRGGIESWSSIVGQRVPTGLLPSTVHGALRVYDLPELVRTIDPAKLTIQP